MKWPSGIGLACLALATTFQFLCALQPLEFLIDVVFERDDAFYYFLIARNVAETGQATFDGIHLSNGVQLLWHYVLVGLAYIVPDKIEYLRAALGLCIALNVLVGVLFWRLGRRLHSAMLGDVLTILWAGIMIERWNTLQGMEFSLHIAVIVGILLMLWKLWQTREMELGLMAGLGLLLTFNYWIRLDAVIFSIAIWGGVFVLIRQRASSSRIMFAQVISLTALPALGALAYIWASYDMAETLLPLSGSVKRVYAQAYFEGVGSTRVVIEQAGWWLKVQSLIFLGLVPGNLLDLSVAGGFNPMSQPLHLILPLIAFGLVGGGAFWLLRRFGLAHPFGQVAVAGLALWALAGLHLLVNVFALADFSHVTRHYYGWLLVFWLVWAGVLFVSLQEALPAIGRHALSVVFIFGLGAAYGLLGYQFIAKYEPERANYALIRMDLGAQLSRELPEDAVIAAWNAGVLGYFMDRPVVNLDGLVNDKAFRDVLRQKAPLQDYLRETGVTHLIDHNGRDLTLAFEEKRDVETFFRNGITWDEVEVLQKIEDIYVLEVKG